MTTFVGLKFAIENGSAPLITVTADLSFTGQILVTRAVSVVGAKPSGGKAVFDAGAGCRHFFVDVPGGFVSIENAELTGGYAAPNGGGGGAVQILHGDVQFASTRFAYNVAAGAGMSGAGGAVLFDEGFTGSASFIDCAFISNNGGNSVGGAISMHGAGTYTVTRCLFFDNAVYRWGWGGGGGGAIYVGAGANVFFTSTIFDSNLCGACGGTLYTYYLDVSFSFTNTSILNSRSNSCPRSLYIACPRPLPGRQVNFTVNNPPGVSLGFDPATACVE